MKNLLIKQLCAAFVLLGSWALQPVCGQEKTVEIPDAYTYSPDSLAFYIDTHCDSDSAKLQTLYHWMVGHMRYNVYPTFVSVNAKRDEQREIVQSLRSREGVCRHFAKIFRAVGERMDIPTFFIEGYTKSGNVVMPDPHAWCAAMVDGKWYFYDPTFGMGYVSNYQFVSSPNSDYCRVTPEKFIANHMPFDPLWQFLSQPLTYPAFDRGEALPAGRQPFDYADTLRVYLQQKPADKLLAANCRIRHNGAFNPLVEYYVQLNTANIAVHRQNEVYDAYKKALKHYNHSVDCFNAVVRYQRQHTRIDKDDRKQLRQWIGDAAGAVAEADKLLGPIDNVPEQYVIAVNNLKETIASMKRKVKNKEEEIG